MRNWAICTPLHVPLTPQTATPESSGAPDTNDNAELTIVATIRCIQSGA